MAIASNAVGKERIVGLVYIEHLKSRVKGYGFFMRSDGCPG